MSASNITLCTPLGMRTEEQVYVQVVYVGPDGGVAWKFVSALRAVEAWLRDGGDK